MKTKLFCTKAFANSKHAAPLSLLERPALKASRRPGIRPTVKQKPGANRLALAVAAALAALSPATTASAAPLQTGATQLFWNGQADNAWTDNNWSPTAAGGASGFIPSSTTDVVFSITTGATNENTSLNFSSFTIHSLTVNDPVAVTISQISGESLTISGSSGTTGITVNSGAGLLTINAPLILAGTSNTITVNNAAGMVISDGVGGSIGLVKAGTGTLSLTHSATYTGATVVNGGTLVISGGNDSVNIATTSSITINNGGTISIVGDNNYLGFLGTDPVTQTTTINQGGTLTMAAQYVAQLGPVVLAGGTLATTGTPSGDGVLNGTFDLFHGVTAGGVAATSTISAQNVALVQSGGTVFNVAPGAANGIDLNVTGSFADSVLNPSSNTGLIKQGAGVMVLSGDNTFIEATTISAGTLQYAKEVALYNNSPASVSKVTVASGATIAFNVGGTGEFTAADLNVIQANSTGFASGARLGLDTTNAAGGSFTYGSPITDANGGASSLVLVKLGTNTLILTGANTYTGGTIISAGTLQIGNGGSAGQLGAGNVVDNAALTFDLSSSATVSNFISGSGGLNQNGTGRTILTAANTYTGATIVNAGTLEVDGSIASANTYVNSGGLLQGIGSIAGSVNNNGGVHPGDSPGTLTVKGNYTQTSFGNLRIDIASPTSYSFLKVGGQASLAGSVTADFIDNVAPARGETFTILTAGGGVSGKFTLLQTVNLTNNPMFPLTIEYLPNEVLLEFTQTSFASIPGLTPNELAVADAIDKVLSNPRFASLVNHLDNEPISSVVRDLDRLSPEELTAIYQIAVSQAQAQTFNLQRRLEDLRYGSNGFSSSGFAVNGSTPEQTGSHEVSGPPGPEGKEGKSVFTPAPDNRWGFFVTGSGEFTSVGDSFNARGYDFVTGGFTLGVDYKIGEHFAIGLATGYDHTDADLTNGGRVTVDGGKLALYGTYFTGKGFYTDLAVQGGYNSYDTTRAAVQGPANGTTDGGVFNMLFGTGYEWKIGGLAFGPTANFEYSYMGFDGYNEHGSLAPLRFPYQSQDSLRTTFGAKASYDWKIGNVTVVPEVRLGWQHEYDNNSYELISAFDQGGPAFTAHGPAIGADSLVVGAGFAVRCSERCSTYVYYDGELGRTNYESNVVSGGFRIQF